MKMQPSNEGNQLSMAGKNVKISLYLILNKDDEDKTLL